MAAKNAARFDYWVHRLLETFIIGAILIVATFVIGGLRLYCWLSPNGHQWVTLPGDNMFVPAMPDECRRCGKQREPGRS